MYYDYTRPSYDGQLIRQIEKAIDGEYTAILCYEHMAKLAPDEKQRDRILEIRKDEIRHFHTFSHLYVTLTGNHPKPQMTEKCPDTYREAVQSAFKDEQETVDFYLEISDSARDPYIKEAFRRAAADEQNHAVWFLSFLTQH
ncbi:hypothetical protein PAESOLCIP111_05088 [Paenibacillus solanacearum]|uniref:Rubrerythrin diiron-binding domain-containing protein n=1 Tax=Paenibacillus solanacearum TaxID=2048548 RepID=A0A916K5H4_9BACL|nr:ferritin-like domain-containing protein [Paenibacillus solanacearum]CAG7646052.1 hypothetical protein PAESOLCIP111_05088 [Paenibacillus solanacearum]